MNELLCTDFKMIFHTKKYYITLICTVLSAFVSIFFIKLIERQYNVYSSEIVAMLSNAEYLNLYLIRVKNIEELLNLTGADMLYLCFSGFFLPANIAFFSISWITYGYKTGMTRFLVARGYARYQIVISKFISGIIGALGVIWVYLGTSVIGCTLFLNGFGKIHIIDFLFFFYKQIIIYVTFVILCMAVIYIIENEVMAIVCIISLIVAVPDLLRYLGIFMNRAEKYEWLWILNYSSKLALGEEGPLGFEIFLLTITLVMSILISINAFSRKEIK